ncbi:Fur-regulated basic protein FbpA [Halobacillus litoralis]|uniref:Fur-regulated basic protein FbpA n=1 Tax=Halobacillus litoralis TaxID=45668 RepID=A0A410MCD4_9BACI|nr:Fur-regulated basic protein FbpA [Halobacillus litoralis]QAS52402.1 Fur-regulated basic protein FbpA [Halobacillus litoralis]
MNLSPTRLSEGVEERRNHLIHKLWTMGYTEDCVGKRTDDMTLTELEQIHINLRCQIARRMEP